LRVFFSCRNIITRPGSFALSHIFLVWPFFKIDILFPFFSAANVIRFLNPELEFPSPRRSNVYRLLSAINVIHFCIALIIILFTGNNIHFIICKIKRIPKLYCNERMWDFKRKVWLLKWFQIQRNKLQKIQFWIINNFQYTLK